jgi:LytS/YehU family sensor histidine kinase
MRLILAGSRKGHCISLNRRNRSPHLLSSELEQLTKQHAFDFKIERLITDMDPDDLHIPGMMIQPFVENAIKHGIPDQKDGRIDILFFRRSEDELVCTVRDNGIGINASKMKRDDRTR